MFKNYFRTSWRSLIKNRQFTILNLIGLSTALACTLLIFLWVMDELSVDKFHEKDDQLYKVMYNLNLPNEILTLELSPYPIVNALVKEMPEVEYAVGTNPFMDFFAGKGVISNGDRTVKAQGIFATKDYFKIFSYRLIEGSRNEVLTNKNGVVISERLANKLFNSTKNIIGKTVKWDHRLQFKNPLQISGVFKEPPPNSTSQFDLIFNFGLLLDADPNSSNWKSTYSETYLVLKKGTDIEKFNQKIKNFTHSKDPANKICTSFIQKYSDKYLHGQYKNGVQEGGRIQYVKLFSIIALFTLLVACINFMNLSTAQASKRMKEIGIKKTLGANRQELIIQFLTESIFTAFVAMIIAFGLIALLLSSFNEITGKQIPLRFDINIVLSAFAIMLITGFIAGCYPAFYLSGFHPLRVLKGKLNSSLSEAWIRKGLVVFQFSMSITFIAGFFVVNKQIRFIQTKNLGFNRDNIIRFQREGNFNENPEVFLSLLKNIPGVLMASTMPGDFLDGKDRQSGFSWRGDKLDEAYMFHSPRIGYDVIETLGIQTLMGRSFSKEFKDNESKIILNEAALKLMQLQNPIGKLIKTVNEQSEIIGVVKNFQYGSLHNTIEPLIFRFRDSRMGRNVLVKIKADSENAIAQIENLYKKHHPGQPFDFGFLDNDYRSLYASEQRIASLSKFFAGLAIIISCLGLFGLAAFTAQKRQKEIGIRKILGATVNNIIAMLSKDFLKLVLIAFAIATPLSWLFMNQWLKDFAHRITISWWIFFIAGAFAILIAVLTVSFQAIKAAIANPVKSLRTE